jgi:hypothetical protein
MQIKIGGVDYPVSDRDDLHDNHKPLYGWIKFNTMEILINSELGPQARYTVLWHEIVHGILNHAGFDEQDEKLVCALGHGLVQVLRDNPELLKLLASVYSPAKDDDHSPF